MELSDFITSSDSNHPCIDYPTYCVLNLGTRVVPPPPQRFTTPSTHHSLPHSCFCLHPSQLPATTAAAPSPCTCYPTAATANPPPHLQLTATTPLPSSDENALGVAGLHRSPKRQVGAVGKRVRGGGRRPWGDGH